MAIYGSATFVGTETGTTYTKDMYISDVANANVNFDSGAGASSSSPTEIWFDEPVLLKDIAVDSGAATAVGLRLIANGNPTGQVFRFDNHLFTNNNRPKLAVGFRAGSRIGFLQL